MLKACLLRGFRLTIHFQLFAAFIFFASESKANSLSFISSANSPSPFCTHEFKDCRIYYNRYLFGRIRFCPGVIKSTDKNYSSHFKAWEMRRTSNEDMTDYFIPRAYSELLNWDYTKTYVYFSCSIDYLNISTSGWSGNSANKLVSSFCSDSINN